MPFEQTKNNQESFIGLFSSDRFFEEKYGRNYVSIGEIERVSVTPLAPFTKRTLRILQDTLPEVAIMDRLVSSGYIIFPCVPINNRKRLIEIVQTETNNSLGKVSPEIEKIFTSEVKTGWYAVRFIQKVSDLGLEENVQVETRASLELLLWLSIFRRLSIPISETSTAGFGQPIFFGTNNIGKSDIIAGGACSYLSEIIGPFPNGLDRLKTGKSLRIENRF